MTEPAEDRIFDSFTAALAGAERFETPYRHWFADRPLPGDIIKELQSVAFPVGDLEGVSGKRELHNDTRHYVDQANIARIPAFAALAHAFQAPRMVRAIEDFFTTSLGGTLLRIEYAQDAAGFWLEPHTDLGVKRLTVLIYLSDGEAHDNLGTDVFTEDKEWAKRSPFRPNFAMAFVPSDNTYHGFQQRDISGVRKSLILNYVTTDWRDREQLAFPEKTVSAR